MVLHPISGTAGKTELLATSGIIIIIIQAINSPGVKSVYSIWL